MSKKNDIEEIQASRSRKAKLERVSRDTSERKWAEEALRESEKRYRAIFEQAADSIVLFDAKTGIMINFNNKAHENLGYSSEEFQRLKLPDIDACESEQEVAKHIEKVVRGEAGTFETKHRTKSGEIRDVLVNAKVISTGGRDLIQAIWSDITEHKRAEEALRRSEKQASAAIEAAKGFTFNYDIATGKINWGGAIEEITGYTPEEFAEVDVDGWAERIHPDDKDRVLSILKEAIEEKDRATAEYRFGTKKGGYVTLSSISLTERENGKAVRLVGILQDITEGKKAEVKLKKSEANLARAQQLVHLGSWDWDVQEDQIKWSHEMYRIWGYEPLEFIPKYADFLNSLHPDDRETVKKAVSDTLTKKIPYNIEYRIKTKGSQERIINAQGEAEFDKRGQPIRMFGTALDITERKKAEEKLLDYQGQLKSLASQLTLAEERERRRIAGGLHDQISQSLVISKIKLDMLRSFVPSQDLVKELNEISDSLYQTLQDIRSLTFDLSFPILYELGFEAAAAAWLVEQIQGKYGIASEFEDDEQPKPLDDDVRVLLFRNMRELLINVVRHANAKKVKVSVRKVGSEIQVSVEDNGVGFDVAKVVSTSAVAGGFGFFSIRERLEELGGHLEIDSKRGHGTKVTLMAPLKQQNTKGRQK